MECPGNTLRVLLKDLALLGLEGQDVCMHVLVAVPNGTSGHALVSLRMQLLYQGDN